MTDWDREIRECAQALVDNLAKLPGETFEAWPTSARLALTDLDNALRHYDPFAQDDGPIGPASEPAPI